MRTKAFTDLGREPLGVPDAADGQPYLRWDTVRPAVETTHCCAIGLRLLSE